jgi:hypothetical protein
MLSHVFVVLGGDEFAILFDKLVQIIGYFEQFSKELYRLMRCQGMLPVWNVCISATPSRHTEHALVLPRVFFRRQRRSWRRGQDDWLCERARRTPDEWRLPPDR